MLIVGLSGGIASGKSTVSHLFREHNVPVVDLDILARRAVEPGTRALSQIIEHFGRDKVLKEDGTLDRDALGRVVFGDEQQRRKLNAIVHPAVRRLMIIDLVKLWLKGERLAVVDAPLLIEAGLWRLCGRIVIVYCSEALQEKRLLERNGGTADAARKRIKAQHPLHAKLKFADHVIDNSGSQKELEHQVDRVISRLRRDSGVLWWFSWLLPPFGLISGLCTVFWRLYVVGVGQESKRRRKVYKPGNPPETIELVSTASITR